MRTMLLTSTMLLTCITVGCLPLGAAPVQRANGAKHVVIFKESDRFAGWPANNGIWSWGDEIVVGFTLGYHKHKPSGGHPIDPDKPSVRRLARSRDGGRTWEIETPSFLDNQGREKEPAAVLGAIDFTNPNFAMLFRMAHSNSGYSWFYYSYDRCHTWNGPFRFPNFDRKGIFARTDTIVLGKHDLMAFVTAARDDGGEGWPFCARTTDGGKTWDFVSWIGPQPQPGGYAIMPSTVRLSGDALLTMIRRREKQGGRRYWLEAFISPDMGRSWYMLNEPRMNNEGNPAHLVRLRDDRLVVTYGHRGAPYGLRARISSDNGQTWGEPIVLRDDGASWDLGYPRTVQRADGKVVTVYYFNTTEQKERFIAGTIWDPGPSSAGGP